MKNLIVIKNDLKQYCKKLKIDDLSSNEENVLTFILDSLWK